MFNEFNNALKNYNLIKFQKPQHAGIFVRRKQFEMSIN